MAYFAGLDVSLNLTSICVVDASGEIIRELKVPSEAEDLVAALRPLAADLERVGLEAGPLSQHIYSALTEAQLPVVCVEARHMAQVLRAQTMNKTDRNDARGLAQMMRVGLFKPVHIKSDRSQRLNVLLQARKVLKSSSWTSRLTCGASSRTLAEGARSRPRPSRSEFANSRPSTLSWPR
jgi:transposase